MRGAPTILLLTLCAATPACRSAPNPEYDLVDDALPSARALLDGLKKGDRLGTLEVGAIGRIEHGCIPVLVQQDAARGRIEVCRAGDGPLPVTKTTSYALFFGRDSDAPLPSPESLLSAACEALAARVHKVEDTVPAPPGLSSYGPTQPPR